MAIIPYITFAHADLDTDPFSAGTQFDSKPLDEAEQEDKDISDIWTISIIIVASLLIVRIAFQIIKKRRARSDYPLIGAGGNLLKQSAHRSSLVVIPLGSLKLNFLTSETENFCENLLSSFLHS